MKPADLVRGQWQVFDRNKRTFNLKQNSMIVYQARKKSNIKLVLIALSLGFVAPRTYSQTYISAPVTAPLAAGSYYSNSQITLSPGFGFTASSGQSLQLYISDCAPLATTPSSTLNYVLTSTPRTGITATSGFANRSTCDLMQAVQYFDGLGRPIQTVQVMGSPTDKDIVQPVAYDQLGREANKYLPYAISTGTSDGSYKSDALSAGLGVFQFYNPGGSGTSGNQQGNGIVVNPNPYATTGFEPSPLNRVVEQGAQGTPWQVSGTGDAGSSDHTVRIVYGSNDQTSTFSTTPGSSNMGSHIVALYTATINADQSRTLARNGTATYGAGVLYLKITRDENWNPASDGCVGTTEEYKDKEGHVVLKRTYNIQSGLVQMLSTYYVYDDLGNLAFVLPPAAGADNAIPTTAQQTAYCYQYGYDERNRLTQKTLPGKGLQTVVYNRLDQPVLTQDAKQQVNKQWTVTKYDAEGRVIMIGLWSDGTTPALSPSTLQSNVYGGAQWDLPDATNNNTTYPTGYVITSYPAISTVLTVNYYDNYNNIPGKSASPYTGPSGYSTMTNGLLTATKTAVLNTPADILLGVHYYDDLGRMIKTYQQHYLGGTANINNYDAITSTYDFTNTVTTTTRQHFTSANTSTPSVTITDTYVYDHMGRKKQTYESINGAANVLLSQSDYNEIGQVMIKHLHSTNGGQSFLQNIGYTYNERGWLLSSSAALFEMQLQYNNVSGISGISPVAQYNGNIASQSWGTQAAQNTTSYTYGYDRLNRLTSGISTNNNNEQGITYDLNGNIKTLQRSGYSNDNLTYTYLNSGLSNQIASIADVAGTNAKLGNGTTTYGSYDQNGNMLSRTNSGTPAWNKSFTYNLLNLPQSVTVPTGTITYTYDAGGQKLRKVAVINGVTTATDYIGGIQYKNNGGTIDFIQTEEGKASNTGSGYDYTYYLGDNLGNTRVTFDTNAGSAASLQTDSYYPFGLEISGTQSGSKNEYLYNKKELQEEFSEYDYGARFYDPVIARWNVIDRFADHPDQIYLTPYNYVGNNPIVKTDPDGNCPGPPCDVPIDRNAPSNSLFGSYQPPKRSAKGGEDGVEVAASRLSTAGMVTEGAGIVAAFVPGAEEFSPVLITTGSNMEATGTIISAANDFSKGNNTSGFIKLGTAAVFKTIDLKIDGLKVAKLVTKTGKNVLAATNFAAGKVADKMVEKGTEKINENKQKSLESSKVKPQATSKKKDEKENK